MRKLVTICAVAAVVGFFGAGTAGAQAIGTTAVSIDLQPLVILHYYSSIDLTITSAHLAEILTGSSGVDTVNEGTYTDTSTGATLLFDAAMSPSNLSSSTTADVTIENAWAVRALATSAGNVEVEIAITDATLTNTAGGTSEMTNETVTDSTGTNSGATITFASPGLANPEIGDVGMTLNFSAAEYAGTYDGGEFTITATST